LASYATWTENHREQADRLSSLRHALAEKTRAAATVASLPLDARHHLVTGLAQPNREGSRHLVRAAVSTEENEVRHQATQALREREVWFLAGLEAHLAAWVSSLPVADAAWPAAFTSGRFEPENQVGNDLNDVSFEVAGEKRHLSDYGGVRVVEVWATWCPPCVPALAQLDVVANDYEGRGVTVIAIGTDQTRESIDNALEGTSLDMVIGWAPDGRGQTDTVSIPTTFVVDSQGKVLDQMHGAVETKDRIRAVLDAALATP
jgi:thiol-disulfide isomerase/thioredoxin